MAMGFDKLLIPVMIGKEPYGFIGKYQAIKISESDIPVDKIVNVLIKSNKTRKAMAYALMEVFENSNSLIEAKINIEQIKKLEYWDDFLIERLKESAKNNSQIRRSFGVPKTINYLIEKFYADSHKGFIIVFNRKLLESEIFNLPIRMIEVKYNGLPHLTLTFESNDLYIGNEKRLFRSKLKDWRLEKEVRIIKNEVFHDTYQRYLKFKRNCIAGILFGGRMNIKEILTINRLLIAKLVFLSYQESPFQFWTAHKNNLRNGMEFVQTMHLDSKI